MSKIVRRKVIGLEPSHQVPLIEWSFGHWTIWLNYKRTGSRRENRSGPTEGTFLTLHNNGQVVRMTLTPDGSLTNVIEVQPAQIDDDVKVKRV